MRRLDALVITHSSADHDGGAAAVLPARPVGAVLDGGEASQPTPGRRAAAADPNLRATVLHVTDGAFDLLPSADAESDVLRRLALPPMEAMKVPHNGSDDPALPEILRRVRPQVAVIPVGRNTYGHPAPSALAALRAAVPVVRRTDRDGTVRVGVEGGRIRVEKGE